MITRNELLEQARLHDLNEADIQRDYVFGWVLSGLYRESALGEILTLKGGNALRKGYFPGTRFSSDLDFGTAQGLSEEGLLEQFNDVCRSVALASGIPFDLQRNRVVDHHGIDGDRAVYKLQLYFKDFVSAADHIAISVRLDVTEYDRLYLPVQARQLIHPYSDATECTATIQCVKLEEALADKMKCLLQRRYCFDLFDLAYGAFVSREIEVDRAEMLRVFFRKTIFGSSPIAARSLLLDLPLDLFRGYWHTVLVPAASRLSFDNAVARLRDGIEELFAPLPAGAYAAAAFYPSSLRNPILKAGSSRRLLRLTYDGVTRVVEPYSLVFKRRRDGIGQEYLYVWDRTGGRRSGPGIKALFHWKVQNLAVTEELFEPRFAVELGKAGDADMAGRFVGRRTSGPRRRAAERAFAVECSYCGKRFRRKTASTKMNKHSDPYGNSCYGRRGWVVS